MLHNLTTMTLKLKFIKIINIMKFKKTKKIKLKFLKRISKERPIYTI